MTYGCIRNLRSIKEIIIPNTLEGIPDTSIADLFELRKITIPQSIKYIGPFSCNFPKLTQLIFAQNSSLISIGDHFLIHCQSIRYLVLPNSLQTLSNLELFYDCTNLKYIYYFGAIDHSSSENLLNLTSSFTRVFVSPSYPTKTFGCKNVTVFSNPIVQTCDYNANHYTLYNHCSYLYLVFIVI